jgi:hypothetical protein
MEYAEYPRSTAAALPLGWCWPTLVRRFGRRQSTRSGSLLRRDHTVPDEIVILVARYGLSRSLLGKCVSIDVWRTIKLAILPRERGNKRREASRRASFHTTGKFPIDWTRCFFPVKREA